MLTACDEPSTSLLGRCGMAVFRLKTERRKVAVADPVALRASHLLLGRPEWLFWILNLLDQAGPSRVPAYDPKSPPGARC